MRRIFPFVFLLLSLVPGVLKAAKAAPGFYLHTQPDGTRIEVQMVGDEHSHYYLTRQGTMMLKEGQTLYVPDRFTRQELFRKKLQAEVSGDIEALKRKFPCTGSPHVPVILVEFTDTTFSLPNPAIVFDRCLNSEDLRNDDTFTDSLAVKRNTGSVRQYFRDMSFGKFTPQFDIYGPVKLEHPLSYYGANNNTALLCKDACAALDSLIDFSQYDLDGNGEVDLVYMIAAGYSESYSQNSSDCLWPQVVWGIDGGTFDGKRVTMAGVSCELHGYPGAFSKAPLKRCAGIGLFVHEFGHALGLPDLYTTSNNAIYNNSTLEDWDVMDGGEYKDNGGYTPSPYTAYERKVLGWLDIDTLREDGEYTVLPLDKGGKAYCIEAEDTDVPECYFLEGVQNQGWGYWGTSSDFEGKGHGLMIIHAYNPGGGEFVRGRLPNNQTGEKYTEEGKTLSGADTTYVRYRMNSHYHCLSTDTILISLFWVGTDYFGNYYTRQDQNRSMMAVPFPGPNNVTAFDATTRSRAWIYQGDGLMHKSLHNIREDEDGTVTFLFENDKLDGIRTPITTDRDKASSENAPAYNLQGMRVGAGFKGWTVRNGKVQLRK